MLVQAPSRGLGNVGETKALVRGEECPVCSLGEGGRRQLHMWWGSVKCSIEMETYCAC